MKLFIKILLALFALLIGLIVLGGVLVFSYIDAFAKEAVERGGTHAMEVETTLDKADVGIFSGTFAIHGLNVANPAGFDTPHFLKLASANASLDRDSLGSDTIRIPEVTLSGIDMHMQRTAEGSNYQTILNSIKRLESGEAPPPDPDQPSISTVIDTLTIRDITVHLDLLPLPGPAAVLTQATQLTVEIPEIVMTNVGGDEPVPTAELAGIVLKAVFQAVLAKAGNVLPEGALGDLRGTLSQLESLGDLGVEFTGPMQESLNRAIDDASQNIRNTVDDGVNRVRDLNPFNRNNNDSDDNEGDGDGGG